jgi:hypothetical protein
VVRAGELHAAGLVVRHAEPGVRGDRHVEAPGRLRVADADPRAAQAPAIALVPPLRDDPISPSARAFAFTASDVQSSVPMPNEPVPLPVSRGRRFGDAGGSARRAVLGWLGGQG